MTVLVVGTLTFDMIATVEGELRDDSLTTRVNSIVEACGGRGANFAIMLAAMRHDVKLVACAGPDFHEGTYQPALERPFLDTRGLYRTSFPTPRVFIFSGHAGSRVYQYRDRSEAAEGAFQSWVEQRAAQDEHIALYCTSEILASNATALRVSKARHKVFAPGHDTVAYDRPLLDDCLSRCDVLIVNSLEANRIMRISGTGTPELAERLRALIVTQGQHGCLLYTKDGQCSIQACTPDNVVDPAGAGDAFAAGFMAGLVRGENMVRAAQRGNAFASFIVEAPDCQSRIPSQEEVESRILATYG